MLGVVVGVGIVVGNYTDGYFVCFRGVDVLVGGIEIFCRFWVLSFDLEDRIKRILVFFLFWFF